MKYFCRGVVLYEEKPMRKQPIGHTNDNTEREISFIER